MAIIDFQLTQSRKRAIQIIATFLFVLFILSLIFRISFISNISHGFLGFITNTTTTIYRGIGRLTKSESTYILERNEFQAIAADLALDNVRFEQLENEVLELQALLSYQETIPYEYIVAKIILRSESGEQTILIDKGSVDGMRESLPVVVQNGHMIGYVSQVRKNSSTVTLLQHEQSRIPTSIVGKTETNGLTIGKEGFLLTMDFVPQRIEMMESDIIVTSGVEGKYPQGLVIGSIETIYKDESSPFQQADIQPFYDVNNFHTVMVLNPYQSEE